MREKLSMFLTKTAYIWEFIYSILLAICSYQLLIQKYYYGYWSKKHIIVTVLIGLVTLLLIIYNLKLAKKQLEKIFITFMIPVGIFYMIFMLPTYAPDESAHIWRTYDISLGNIFTRQEESGYTKGVDLPEILIEIGHERLNKYKVLNELINKETDYNNTANVISTAQGYPFVLYIPASIIFLIIRLCNVSMIYGIYLAKLCNFIIFLIGGYYAIKKIPFGKYIILTCLFLPMVISQAISLSADSMINTIVFVYIAFTLSLLFQENNISNKQKTIYVLLTIFISIAKMAYIPLIGLGFLLIFTKKMTKRDKIIILGVGALICLALVLANYKYTSQLKSPISETYNQEQNINSVEQIKYLIQNPFNYINMLINTCQYDSPYYIGSMIGSDLGWLNISVSQTIIKLFIIMLACSCIIENNKETFSLKQKMWVLLLVLGVILVIITATYLLWTPVGSQLPAGIQGRYFIPILPLFLLCISMKGKYIPLKWNEIIVPAVLTILNIFVISTIFKFFII